MDSKYDNSGLVNLELLLEEIRLDQACDIPDMQMSDCTCPCVCTCIGEIKPTATGYGVGYGDGYKAGLTQCGS